MPRPPDDSELFDAAMRTYLVRRVGRLLRLIVIDSHQDAVDRLRPIDHDEGCRRHRDRGECLATQLLLALEDDGLTIVDGAAVDLAERAIRGRPLIIRPPMPDLMTARASQSEN